MKLLKNLKEFTIKGLVVMLSVLVTGGVFGQTYYNMSSGNYSQNFADMANWTNNYAAGSGANNWKVAATATGSTVSTGTVFVTGTTGGVQKGTQSLIILASGTNSSATDLLLNFSGRIAGNLSLDWVKVVNSVNNSNPRSSDLKFQYSTNGTSFTDITGYTIPRINNNSTAESGTLNITLPTALDNQSTVILRFFVWNNGQTGGAGNRPKWQIDNISTTSTPEPITTSVSSLTAFSSCVNIQSDEKTFTVSGANLTDNITVAAPTGFQISTTSGSGYTSSVTLTQSGGNVASTTIYAVMSAQASNPTSGSISCSSTGATTKNVSVSGTVLNSPSITTNPSNVSVASGGNTSFTGAGSNTPTSYTWQVSTDGTNWSTISNGGVYSNATTATLNITGATIGMNGYKYKVSATNNCGTSSYSNVATLTVTYCTPTYSSGGASDYMTSISLVGNNGTLSQSTSSNASPYYINYTSTQNIVPQLTKGTTYTLSITFAGDANQYNGVWVDFNQNGTLSTSEFFTSNTNAGASGTASVSIAVPAGATTGQCLIRIRGGEDSQVTSGQACGASSSIFGQAQDYYINIVDPVPPTITSLGSSSGCVGSSITINGTNLSGVTAANVTIGGTAVSSITSNTSTQIVAVIGSGTTGTVSVTTAGGTDTYGTFTVNSAPNISYTGSPFSYPLNSTISNLTPTTNGVSFSSSPTLPTGLTLNPSTGVISGTPTVLQGTTSYTITATGSNSCTNTTTINIAITPINTTCSNAETLSCGTTNGTTNGTTGVAHGIPASATYLSGGVSNYGVWYKFTGDGNSWTVVVTPQAGYDPEVDIMSGSCGSYTAVTSNDGSGAGSAETLTFSTTNGTTYFIYVADFSSSGTTTGTFTINLSSNPSTPTGLTGPAVICSGQTGVFSVTNVPGVTYNWTLPSGWSGTSSTNSITVTPGSNPGMIAVTASTNCGTSTAAGISASVSVFPSAVNAGPDASICLGNSSPLSASVTNGTVTLYNTDANYGTNWTTNDANRWSLSNTTNAGGSNREFRFNWYSSSSVTSTLGTTTTIDATNYNSVAASFRYSVDMFSNNGVTLYFETSPDNTNWTTMWSVTPTADISYPGGTVVNVDLSSLNGTTFYVRYRFTGNTARINDWYVDNLSITGTPNVTYSWINTTTGLNATNVSNPTASPNTTTTYTVQATSVCSTLTDGVQITVNSPNVSLNSPHFIWDGSVNSSFTEVGNWLYTDGTTTVPATTTPTATDDIVIPSGTCVSNFPTISTNLSCDSLIIYNGSTLNLTGGNFTANDDVVVQPGGTLNMSGGAILTVVDGSVKFLGNSTFSAGNGTIKINHLGVENHYLTAESASNNTFYNLEFMGDNDPTDPDFLLGSTINCTNEFKVTSKNVKLNNNNVIFGTTGFLTEGTNGKKVYDLGTGYLESTRTIGSGVTVDPSNLGISITTNASKPLGSTVVRRYHIPVTGYLYNNTSSIGRYYSVTPTFNGDDYSGGLEATVSFNYKTSDLNGHGASEADFTIFRKGSLETTWEQLGGGFVDMTNKTVTYTNFPKFSDVTLGPLNNTPLPVELVDFSANCSEDGILITWRTASEHNTSHFNLEKSRNGFDWEVIHTEGAAGNSNQLITYNFSDRKSIDGLNYYRLNQYDLDGVYEQFGPISINCLKSDTGYFSIFPNPSSNTFSVILNNENLIGESTLMITNELGKIIYTKDLDVISGINLYNIDKLEVTPGVYYISVINNNYTSGVLKQIIR